MSKESIRKGGTPQPQRPGGASNGYGASGRPSGASSRPRSVPTKSRSGFKFGPLEIGLLVAGILVVGLIVFSAFQAPAVHLNDTPTGQAPTVGSVAPAFTGQDFDGKTYNLSDYKGQVVVAEFMATWCPHCQEETPVYNLIYDNYVATGKGVAMLGINATPKGHDGTSAVTIDDLKWFKENWGSKYPLLFDASFASAQAYAIKGYPSVYIIDKNGMIAYVPPADSLPGYEQITAKVEELLKQ